MPRLALDPIDLKILRILRDEGRITNVALAGRVGISPPPLKKFMTEGDGKQVE